MAEGTGEDTSKPVEHTSRDYIDYARRYTNASDGPVGLLGRIAQRMRPNSGEQAKPKNGEQDPGDNPSRKDVSLKGKMTDQELFESLKSKIPEKVIKTLERAAYSRQSRAIEIIRSKINDLSDLDKLTKKIINLELDRRRNWKEITINDVAVVNNFINNTIFIGELPNSKYTVNEDGKVNYKDLKDYTDYNLEEQEQEKYSQIAEQALTGDTLAMTKLYGRLAFESKVHHQDKDCDTITFEGNTYSIAKSLLNSPEARLFWQRHEKVVEQINNEQLQADISSHINNLPVAVRRDIQATNLLADLDTGSEVSLSELNSHLEKLSKVGDVDSQDNINYLKMLVKERLLNEERKTQELMGSLNQIFDSSENNYSNTKSLIDALLNSDNVEILKLGLRAKDDINIQILLAKAYIQHKKTDHNYKNNSQESEIELLAMTKTPEQIMTEADLLSQAEMEQLKQALQSRVNQLRENASDFVKNGRVKMEEASKLVIDTIKEHAPDLLRKLGKGLLVIAVVALVLLVGTMILGSMAVGSQR